LGFLVGEIVSSELQGFRAIVEGRLDQYLTFDAGCPERLAAAMRYSVLAPAKRLRPLLVMQAARTCGGDVEHAVPAACAVEFIHTYSLIHDDLPAMDDDDLRRGRPTCHRQFDEATAILAGDALIPLAFEVVAKYSLTSEIAAACCLELARAAGATQLVGGQADDLAAEFAEIDVSMLEQIHLRKTAAMIAVSLKLGGICAKADRKQLADLEKFGKKLGLAFQITDDLLDLRGEQDKMGKRVQKDKGLGKLTYPSALGLQASEEKANQLVDDAILAVSDFGAAADPLVALARFVVSRTR
jgi:geranylgeranyl diphosphate synthase type II